MDDDDENGGGGLLAGFLFGNIDESGRLENDILDDDAKKHLGQLASFGIGGNLVKELGGSSSTNYDDDDDDESSSSGFQQKSLDCVDYSTIDELAEEVTESSSSSNVPGSKRFADIGRLGATEDHDDYDEEESAAGSGGHKIASILPSIVPKAETMEVEESVSEMFAPSSPADDVRDKDGDVDDVDEDKKGDSDGLVDSSSAKEDTAKEQPPLTGLAAIEGKSVTDLFPEFRPGKVLRFSRLFGPKKYVSAQWKGLKKRKRKRKLLGLDPSPKTVGFDLRYGPTPKAEECEADQAITHLQPIPLSAYGDQYKYMQAINDDDNAGQNGNQMFADWMFGPARYWYHKHNELVENGKFKYGFKEKTTAQKKEDEQRKPVQIPPVDHFNLVCLTQWEDEIIWSSEDYKPNKNAEAIRDLAGWIPSGNIRTMKAYLSQYANKDNSSTKSIVSANILKNFDRPTGPILNTDPNSHKISDWYSIFPIENSQLLYERWEDKIIYDSEAVDRVPSPQIFKLDPNDENLVLNLPADSTVGDHSQGEQTPKKEYKSKSRFMKKNQSQEDDEEEPLVRTQPKNMFNLSNDEYYMPKQDLAENKLQADLSSLSIQHATPAVELQRPFFPTHLWPAELRSFHRPHLTKKKLHQKSGFQVCHSLFKRIKKRSKEREKERQAFGGGEMFFMRQPEDLSGMDGEIVLAEYCEEMPPLLSQPGMNTRIRNYYQRKHGKDSNAPTLEYGDISFVHHSPFLGQLAQGQVLQALENHLFRAPVYQHKVMSTDFLLFITSYGHYIRNLKDMFTVGQLCPKFEVPGPNSKRANNHIRDFLQIFIYRLFWKSPDTPRRIKMEDIRKAFPKHSESSVRKRLKLCADFRRTGADCNWWVLKNDFRLPSEEEMRAMVTPEQTCAYFMMLAAEQRLQDAGYGEKSLFAPDEDDNEDDAKKIDDEIQTAPWNTTRAFIQAMKGKCLLQVTGVADPTGCGEGFSYVRIPNKPVTKDETDEQKQAKKQKLVTGTDADLRRLNLKQARLLLKEFGVPQDEIEKLSRWEVIDKVRTMSTEAAKQGTTEVAMNKFARGSRFTVAEHQEKYKDECQRIFDLQNRVLGSDAILSTDEESSGEEGSDIEDLGKNLESMLSNKKISNEEHEEAERRELQKLLNQDVKIEKDAGRPGSSMSRPGSNVNENIKQENDDSQQLPGSEPHAGRRLIIIRTYKENGREFVRQENVKNQFVIDAYLRIVTKEKNYREVFASQDEKHKEDMRRERRRIQEQLRRIKRNEERERLRQLQQSMNKDGEAAVQPTPEDQAKLDALCDKPTKSLKCGACGEYGHMKTNKMCPKYTDATYSTSLSDDEHDIPTDQISHIPQDDLIKVEGTKITLGRALLEAHEDMRRKSLTIRIPKENVIPVTPPPPPKKKKKSSNSQSNQNPDYLVRHHKSKNRRRTSPLVALNLLLETIAVKLKESSDSWPFFTPVSIKSVPDYYNIVKSPMDLQTIRENIKKGAYHSREQFLDHISLIHSNCVLYNGASHPLTKMAQNIVDLANEELKGKDKEFSEIEREINPLLDEDNQVGLSWLFENILSQLKTMPESWPFHQPVPVKVVPDYYDIIKNPVDLKTLKQRVQSHCYRNRGAFLEDINLLYINSLNYNGAEHAFTKTARKIVKQGEELVKQYAEKFNALESNSRLGGNDYVTTITSPGASHSGVLEDENTEQYAYESEEHGQGNVKQVTAGNEDEFVDIEGEGGMLAYNQQQYVGVAYDGEAGAEYQNMEYGQEIYSGNYDEQTAYQDFPTELYGESYATDVGVAEGAPTGPADENMDLGMLLLQDLVHSDEDEEDSDDDIPLDDGDEDIPLDDGDEEEFEELEEEKVKASDDEEEGEEIVQTENNSDEEFIDVEDDSEAW